MYVPLIQKKDGLEKSIILDWSKEGSSNTMEHSYFIEDFAMLIIENTGKESPKDLDWRKKCLIVNPKNQHLYVKAFKDILKILYDEKNDPFYQKNGHLYTYALKNSQIIRVHNAGINNVFELKPAVIMDNDGIEYEGASLAINMTNNIGPLYLDELEAVYHTLEKLDIFLYSQALLNFYFAYKSKVVANQVTIEKTRKKAKKLFGPKEDEERLEGFEVVKSTKIPNSDPFMGLEGDIS